MTPSDPVDHSLSDCLGRIQTILGSARAQAIQAVNTAMVSAYWEVGREIVEEEQRGAERAEYGSFLIQQLATELGARHERGFSVANLKLMRQFYLAFRDRLPSATSAGSVGAPIGQTPSSGSLPAPARPLDPSLTWSHYCVLMRVPALDARSFYEVECARARWSVRELERQVASLLFERLARSRDREGVLALAREGHIVAQPADLLKDPYVLEFVGLPEAARWREADLEQALIDRLQQFLLELGGDLFFVARQKRITIDGDHFWIDLVFYHRTLRCFLLVDLKVGRLTQQDVGQMLLYTGYYEAEETREGENPPVGLILCTDKNDAAVRYTLGERARQVFASRYMLHLPSEEALAAEIRREREAVERLPPPGEADAEKS